MRQFVLSSTASFVTWIALTGCSSSSSNSPIQQHTAVVSGSASASGGVPTSPSAGSSASSTAAAASSSHSGGVSTQPMASGSGVEPTPTDASSESSSVVPSAVPSAGPSAMPSLSSSGNPPEPTSTPSSSASASPTQVDGGNPIEPSDAGVSNPHCSTAPVDYPNLFVTIAGHTQEESDAKVAAAWNQLYNPANANTVYYDGPDADESYVKDTGNNDVRTEGMSYGMMTAVQLDKQTEFDRLWTWVKNHMANGTGEISWKCTTGGSKSANGGAPDGEEYMATALIFAQKRWGDTGKFNYAEEAQWVLDLIRTKYFNQDAHIIRFVTGSNNTDGSYILPAFYETWACFDTANAEFWNAAVTAGRAFFHVAADANGVIPDQSSFSGQAQGSAGSDAKRCVMNIMMDTNFFGVDPWQTETYAPAFGSYMSSHSDNTAAQFSCNALLGFGLPAEAGKPFLDKLWSAAIPTGNYRYYDGTLYMLSLLHVSGTFKLYY